MNKPKIRTKLSRAQKRRDIITLIALFVIFYALTAFFFSASGAAGADDRSSPQIYLFILMLTLILMAVFYFPTAIIAVVLGTQRGKARRIREDSVQVTPGAPEYYRGMLAGLSPATIGLIAELDLPGGRAIAATLLSMYAKKAVKAGPDGRLLLMEGGEYVLDDSELELISALGRGGFDAMRPLARWKRKRFMEAQKAGYIRRAGRSGGGRLKLFVGIVLLAAGIFLWISFIKDGIDRDYLRALLHASLTGVLIFIPWYMLGRETAYRKRDDVIWERTPLGEEKAAGIAGLARFVREFDTDRLSEDGMRDDFIVYSVMLGENAKIEKDVLKRHNVRLESRFINFLLELVG